MRNPFRTEREAYATVIVVGAGSVAVALAGYLGDAWAALAVFVALAMGGAVASYALARGSAPELERLGANELRPGHSVDTRIRVLVLANETLVGRALHDEIQHRTRDRDGEVLVVAPVLASRLRHWTSDTDQAMQEAEQRLDRSLAELKAAGIEASGRLSDGEPLQALEDALRAFAADEVIISTHPPDRSHWLESNLVPAARARFPVPITHVVVDLEHERARIQERTDDRVPLET